MANYINKYTNIEAYNADDGKQYPNVSYLIDVDIIKWEKNDPVHIICKYNVTSTSEATKLLGSSTGITYQIIDDVKQDTVQTTYTFETLGEHTVKYKLDGTSIANSAFNNCDKLTSVTIPDSVTKIGINAFRNCTKLTSVTIPNSVTKIEQATFYDCSGLTSVTIPNSVTEIGIGAFQNCTKLTSVTIPNSVTKIEQTTFYNCSALTSITIPNSVTKIDDYVFYNCSALTSITIPNSVTSITYSAFYRCSGLTSITIPNSVTSIGKRAFSECSGLTSITIEATTPPTLSSIDAFNYTNNCPIYVPAESVDAYKTATNWSSLADRISAIVP